jgi:hypothetical protein
MAAFLAFVEFLVAIGLLVTLASNYLIVNKLWKRRATRDVAESISISAALLGLFTSAPLFLKFMLIDHSAAGAAKTAISMATGIVFVLIGSGLWVAEYRGRGFGRLFLRALSLERREAGDLIKAFIQPHGADRILEILHRLATIDRDLDEREEALIREFAQHWRLPVPELRGGESDLLALRQSMVDYLALDPPREQVAQLLDLLLVFAKADDRVAWEEELALDELSGLVHAHLSEHASAPVLHEVLIVPQSAEQFDAVRSLLPGREEKMLRGGKVFSVGSFFSPRYAEVVCQKYIALGLFTALVADQPGEAGRHAVPA